MIYLKIFVFKTYQSYKNTNAQGIGNKTARHFLQFSSILYVCIYMVMSMCVGIYVGFIYICICLDFAFRKEKTVLKTKMFFNWMAKFCYFHDICLSSLWFNTHDLPKSEN